MYFRIHQFAVYISMSFDKFTASYTIFNYQDLEHSIMPPSPPDITPAPLHPSA